MVALEEFLREKYVEHYSESSNQESKIFGILSIPDIKQYFYQPPVGVESYVVDKDGFALYLINKKNLPKEIRESLVGGDAVNGEFTNYQGLKDVYGVTEDLNVYYCSDGKSSIYGVTVDKLNKDDKLRDVIDEKSSLGSYLLGKDIYDNLPSPDGKLNAEELRTIWELEIDESANLTNLNELYNLTNLQELKLTNLTLDNLDGMEYIVQLEKIEFNNCRIKDYSKLCNAEKLVYLYFNNTVDDEIVKFSEAIKDTDFPELKYFGIMNCGENLSTIESLSNLEKITDTVSFLDFYNNTNISRYDSLVGFTSVTDVSVYGSKKLESLSFIKNMNKIKNIYSYDTNLSDSEEEKALDSLSEKNELEILDLQNNKELEYLRGIANSGVYDLKYFYLAGCPKLRNDEVMGIANIFNRTNSASKNIDKEFKAYLNGISLIDFSNKNLSDNSEDIKYLEGLDENFCLNIEVIRLNGNVNLSNKKLNEILPKFKNCVSICLNECHNLTSIEFVREMKHLEDIILYNTGVSTETKDEKGNFTGLELLNDCENLKSIEINNSIYNDNSIVLKNIVNVLNRCRRDTGLFGLYYYGVGVCRISNLVDQLPTCEGLTYFELSRFTGAEVIDFSKVESEVSFGYQTDMKGVKKIILPKHVGSFRLCRSFYFDFSYCETIKGVYNETDGALDEYKNIKELSDSGCKIFKYTNYYFRIKFGNELEVEDGSGGKIKVTYADCINLLSKNNLEELYINRPFGDDIGYPYELQLDGLDVSKLKFSEGFENLKVFSAENCRIQNLNFLKDCINLEKIDCVNCGCENLDELSGLKNVKEIIINNNKIKSLRFLKDYNKLELLNISGNLVSDEYVYNTGTQNEDGTANVEIGYNIDILVNLHRNHNLHSLYIERNLGMTESYKLTALGGWRDKKGF